MKKWVGNILAAIGETPLVWLPKISPQGGARIFAKLESVNPGGSIKSRTAFAMIEAAEQAGLLRSDSVIVEVSSGNQGIALAMIGAVKGYAVRIIMPESMSIERQKLIKAYGAEIELTPAGANIAEAMEIALKTAKKMAERDNRIFMPCQFENPANPSVHRDTTAQEILAQLDCPIDALVAGFGTGGTLTGVGEVLKAAYPKLQVIAVEPENAAVLSGGNIGQHIQQGIGDGFIPIVLNTEIINSTVIVSDAAALAMAKQLASREGIFCGISSGANVHAASEIAKQLGEATTVVTILPDTGERYLSTGLFDG